MLNKEVREKFNKLKNNGNYKSILQLIKNHGEDTQPMKRVVVRIINNQFTNEINGMALRLYGARGVMIRAKQDGVGVYDISIVKDGETIAGIIVSLEVGWLKRTPGAIVITLNLESGSTLPNYSKTGPMRPASGPGYGTILRALIVHAAKKLGYNKVLQTSAYVTNENNLKFIKGEITRPVSAWIMNKLGFNINKVIKEPGTNKIKYEERVLILKNRNTPKLNAVVREIFNKNASRGRG